MIHFLTDEISFPPVTEANHEGLLAIGGDLKQERLLLAYKQGIFPWFNEDELPMWWCPDPRFVLFPDELKISKSMKQVLKKNLFQFRYNSSFRAVITACQQQERVGQDGTWISDAIINAYEKLHFAGIAISAEAWQENRLVGGLYGIRLGKLFFGESMFSQVSNASKFAFIQLVAKLKEEEVQLIDCQVYTEHLQSLGAKFISREQFLKILEK